jgi:stage II sporulation protein AA (anti-sigma F factor antagonist)
MQIARQFFKDSNVFTLNGNFDFTARQEFQLAIEQAQDLRCSHIILDMSLVPGMDSSGLGRLFLLFYSLQKQGIRLSLLSPCPTIQELFNLVSLPKHLPIFENIEEALAS